MQHTPYQQNKIRTTNHLRTFYFAGLILFLMNTLSAQVNHRTFLHQARKELSEERFVDALRSLNVVIGVRPDLFEPWFLRGVAKYNLGDFSGAESDFSQATQLHPLHIRSYHYRGLSRIKLSNFYDALQDFKRALEFDPYDAGLRMAMGDALISLNRPQEALSEYSMALTIQPRNADAWVKKALVNRELQRVDEALSDLEQAVHYNTFSLEARLRLAMLKSETGRNSEALEDFKVLRRIYPEQPLVFFQQALVHLDLGDTLAALHSLETVNHLEPENTLSLFNRALLHSQLKDYHKAISLFSEVLTRQPTHILSWYNRGVAHINTEQYKEAESDFSRAIHLFPGFVAAWLNRAEARENQKNFKGAAEDRETAVRLLDEQYLPQLPNSPFRNDSLWFNKIMRLESEFIGPGLAKLPQFMPHEITPFGLFLLIPFVRGQEGNIRRDSYSASLDLIYSQGLVFGFVESSKAEQLRIADSAHLQAISPQDLALFGKGLHEYVKGNFTHAIDAFGKLDQSSALYLASRINMAAALHQAELVSTAMELPLEAGIFYAGNHTKPTAPKQPNFDKPIGILETITPESNNTAFVYHNLGYLLLRNGSYHPAIDAFSQALSINPALGETWFNRALVLLFLSENRLACHDLSKAGELGIVQAYAMIRKYCTKP